MVDNPLLNNTRSVDVLYLDNTYCDPSCTFPSRVCAEVEFQIMEGKVVNGRGGGGRRGGGGGGGVYLSQNAVDNNN